LLPTEPDTEIYDLIREVLLEDDGVKNILAILRDGKAVKDKGFSCIWEKYPCPKTTPFGT
jgi:hypothetical protein